MICRTRNLFDSSTVEKRGFRREKVIFMIRRINPLLRSLFLLITLSLRLYSQSHDADSSYVSLAKTMIATGLANGRAYDLLSELTRIGPRLSGSPQAAQAVEWAERT